MLGTNNTNTDTALKTARPEQFSGHNQGATTWPTYIDAVVTNCGKSKAEIVSFITSYFANTAAEWYARYLSFYDQEIPSAYAELRTVLHQHFAKELKEEAREVS